jgi:hypothetical protein
LILLKDENGKAIRMISHPRYHKAKEEELRLKLLETVIVQKNSIIITEANLNERQLPKIVYVNPFFTYDWILLS